VSGSQSGVQYWTVPMDLAAGTTYVYQCTIHSGMVGNLVVV
jgi:plastocyanin